MTVATILRRKGYQVTTVQPTVTIAHVTEVLSDQHIGAVLVVDDTNQLLGIVSERDVVQCIAANGAGALDMTAGQLMTRALRFAHPDTTESQVMAMMTAGRFRHLPVMDNGALVGLISIRDVVESLVIERENEAASSG